MIGGLHLTATSPVAANLLNDIAPKGRDLEFWPGIPYILLVHALLRRDDWRSRKRSTRGESSHAKVLKESLASEPELRRPGVALSVKLYWRRDWGPSSEPCWRGGGISDDVRARTRHGISVGTDFCRMSHTLVGPRARGVDFVPTGFRVPGRFGSWIPARSTASHCGWCGEFSDRITLPNQSGFPAQQWILTKLCAIVRLGVDRSAEEPGRDSRIRFRRLTPGATSIRW
jgi:hypothetical protein